MKRVNFKKRLIQLKFSLSFSKFDAMRQNDKISPYSKYLGEVNERFQT